jgi:hypothetical protein
VASEGRAGEKIGLSGLSRVACRDSTGVPQRISLSQRCRLRVVHGRRRRRQKIMRNRDLVQLRTLGRVAVVLFALPMLVLTFAASAFAQTLTGEAAPTPPPAPLQPSQQQLENWRKNMPAQPPRPGCFTSAYPSNQWQEVPCTTAPAVPFPPARGPRPDTVGNGNDVSAQVSGHISEAVGSFDNVTGVTSESGTGPFGGPTLSRSSSTPTSSRVRPAVAPRTRRTAWAGSSSYTRMPRAPTAPLSSTG